ncbi:phosphate-starvation-inducible PsiE family protein [Phytohalomonas tamaricis]|uniref:phosphate-starvation-inducible PsiE family protein n=1 Tax=Phytohalomonas tamaricis TaxID=2081032 RepID=UPI000D0ADFCB|nr:phosphate-starvation-inducible PsiE family protein [Phytohalomonas tamaricis]
MNLNPTRLIERIGLIVILLAIIAAVILKLEVLWQAREIGVADLLLLFMYLELVGMVHIYWHEGRLSVLLPLYIAIIGISRHLLAETQEVEESHLITGAVAIVLLSISILMLSYGQRKFPFTRPTAQDDSTKHD